jgi:hypothetical protein
MATNTTASRTSPPSKRANFAADDAATFGSDACNKAKTANGVSDGIDEAAHEATKAAPKKVPPRAWPKKMPPRAWPGVSAPASVCRQVRSPPRCRPTTATTASQRPLTRRQRPRRTPTAPTASTRPLMRRQRPRRRRCPREHGRAFLRQPRYAVSSGRRRGVDRQRRQRRLRGCKRDAKGRAERIRRQRRQRGQSRGAKGRAEEVAHESMAVRFYASLGTPSRQVANAAPNNKCVSEGIEEVAHEAPKAAHARPQYRTHV